MNQASPEISEESSASLQRLGPSLYWKGGIIVARVRIRGKRTWRSTGTDKPAEARKWLEKFRKEQWMLETGIEPQGIVLHRKRITVEKLIDSYVEAGCPTRKMQKKSPATLRNEQACLKPIRVYFGGSAAAALTLADCDKYRDWRTSGGYSSEGGEEARKRARMRKGLRSVDLELTILGNVLNLGVRRRAIERNPLLGRHRYTHAADVRHCREVAPTPEGLKQIEHWLRVRKEHGVADLVCFLAYSGVRIGEALPLEWEAVDWHQQIIHVKREKRGINPFVLMLPEMEALLRDMQKRAVSHLLFPAPFVPERPRDSSAVRHRIAAACRSLGLRHVTPHGLRSYFVTQARQSGVSDAEIAMLIGDKTGPAIIAQTYGDIRPDHLFRQAKRIQLTVSRETTAGGGIPERSPTSHTVAESVSVHQIGHRTQQVAMCEPVSPSEVRR